MGSGSSSAWEAFGSTSSSLGGLCLGLDFAAFALAVALAPPLGAALAALALATRSPLKAAISSGVASDIGGL